MKKTISWGIAVIALSILFHLATIAAFPTAVMGTLGYKSKKAGIKTNTIKHSPPVTEGSRSVVRPSPDLIYSIIGYDVSKNAIKVTAPIPDTYWSLSCFTSDTENFYVINDQQIKGGEIEFILYGKGGKPADTGNAIVVESPSNRGAVLLRMLIKDEKKLPALQKIQHQARCDVL